jgi:hypothetical protein
MQQIAAVATAEELSWQQPSAMRRVYELRAGDELAATLSFRSDWGSLATAESADGCWTFKRVGFWQSRVTVRRCVSDEDLATFQHNTWTGGGTLTRADGLAYHLTTNTWQTKLTVLDSQQLPLLHYDSKGWFKLKAALAVEPQAISNPDLPWLAMFGWYVVVMMYFDAASTTAVVTAAT